MPGMLTDKPGTHAAAVTPNDSTVIVARALYVGTGGNVAVTTVEGEVVTFPNVNGGSLLPIQCTKVMASNTTASNIVRIW